MVKFDMRNEPAPKRKPGGVRKTKPDDLTKMVDGDQQPLTVEAAILTYIQDGAYPHIAGQAAGLTEAEFERWMERGQRKGKEHARYRTFRSRVIQAQATARVIAELKVFEKDPEKWLRSGPGKEADARKGWTGTVRPKFEGKLNINILESQEGSALIQTILSALSDHPEARLAAARAIKAIAAEKSPSAATHVERAHSS